VRQVEYLLDRTPEQAAEDLRSGRSRLAQCNSRRAEQSLAGDARFALARRPSLFVKYLGYDLVRDESPFVATRPNPFRNRLVREALHVGIDRAALVAALPAAAVPATQLVPPSIFGFNPSLTPPAYDPERARSLLAEAGLPGGFAATLHVRKILSGAAFAVRDQLAGLGVRVEVAVMNDGEFLDVLRRRASSFHLSRFGCPTGDISDILDNALHTPDAQRHMGVGNYGGYSNPVVDRAIEESAGIDRLQARRAALEGIVSRIMADLAWIPLYVDEDVYAFDRSLTWAPRYDSFVLAAEIGLASPPP
jgi:peptide/nickel transport system substrate-binding protein